MSYKIINKSKNIIVAQKAREAKSFFKRLKGLMFRKEMGKDEALIFYHASSIHTFFMQFPLDIIFLDRRGRIIKIYPSLKPWRFAFCWTSFLTLELPAHKVSATYTKIGDILELVPL